MHFLSRFFSTHREKGTLYLPLKLSSDIYRVEEHTDSTQIVLHFPVSVEDHIPQILLCY